MAQIQDVLIVQNGKVVAKLTAAEFNMKTVTMYTKYPAAVSGSTSGVAEGAIWRCASVFSPRKFLDQNTTREYDIQEHLPGPEGSLTENPSGH